VQNQLTVLEKEELLRLVNSSGLKNRKSVLPPIAPAGREGRVPLSYAQQRLWFLAQMEGVKEAYHISSHVRLRGKLNREALRWALERVVWRHEALRTTFVEVEGEAEQRIRPREESGFELGEQELVGGGDVEEEMERGM